MDMRTMKLHNGDGNGKVGELLILSAVNFISSYKNKLRQVPHIEFYYLKLPLFVSYPSTTSRTFLTFPFQRQTKMYENESVKLH